LSGVIALRPNQPEQFDMTLEEAYFLSQIIAAVAIVASLIYAGLQFRIYAKAAQEARLVAHSNDLQQFRMALVANPDVARIYRDGLEDTHKLDPLDQWRFGALMQMVTESYVLVTKFGDAHGGMTESGWESSVGHRPGYGQWWAKARSMYGEEIRARLDR
jgi:hypothetical protein